MHPTENGDHMYINFSNMQVLIDNINQTICSLKTAKEKIEYERQRLALNTELEDVRDDMKKTAYSLEEKIYSAEKLKLSLVKISELYAVGEERIKDTIEGGRSPFKIKFYPKVLLQTKTDFRWTIE